MFCVMFFVIFRFGSDWYILVSLSVVAKHRMFFLVLDAFGMLHLGLVLQWPKKIGKRLTSMPGERQELGIVANNLETKSPNTTWKKQNHSQP